jgi:hypothetical protein
MGEHFGVQQNPRAYRPANSSNQAAHTSAAKYCHNSLPKLRSDVSPDFLPNFRPDCRPNCRPKLGPDVGSNCRPNDVSSNCLPNLGPDSGPIGVPDHVSDAGAHCELVIVNLSTTLKIHKLSCSICQHCPLFY